MQRPLVAARQAHHPLDQVHAGHLLGHAVLDLQARVDLQKVEGAGVRVQHVFHSAGGAVVHGLAQAPGRVQQGCARVGRQVGRGGLLDHLLVAALGRAVALAQGNDGAVAVAEELHLDVARALDELLQEQAGVLEVGAGQALNGVIGRIQLGLVAHQAHADAATAGRALEHHGVADAKGFLPCVGRVLQQATAGQERHLMLLGQRARGVLQAECPHLPGRGPDEGDARVLTGLGEGGVLREEAVAGMDGARTGLARGGQDTVHVQVALRGGRGADAHAGVGQGHVARVGVCLGVDGHGLQAHLAQRADDAAGDGAAVGDQDGVEPGCGQGGGGGRAHGRAGAFVGVEQVVLRVIGHRSGSSRWGCVAAARVSTWVWACRCVAQCSSYAASHSRKRAGVGL